MQEYFRKQWIVLFSIVVLAGLWIGIQKFFVNTLDHKVAGYEQEQQFFSDECNSKLSKLNKKLALLNNENRSSKASEQELSGKLAEAKSETAGLKEQLNNLQNQKLESDNSHNIEINALKKKLNDLTTDNQSLTNLITQLQQQLKNSKTNSYGLFQAGKLEVELSSLDQKLAEHYDNLSTKKNDLVTLKEKCGVFRNNTKFCDEYDIVLNNIDTLEKQIEYMQEQRLDLKQRINIYLSSSQ